MRTFFVASLLTLCLIQAGPPSARAQRRTPGFTSLSLFAEPEKDEVTLGEPLTIKVRLTNLTDSDIAARLDLDPAYGALQVSVSRNGREFKRYLGPGWGMKDQPGGAPVTFSSGQSVRREVTLLFHNAVGGRDDLLESNVPIDEAGTYLLRVELYDDAFGRKIAAPVISLEVGPPQGEAGQAVWQAVRADKELAFFMQTGIARRAESTIEKAEQLVRRHPGNDLERHLALALGRHFLGKERAETAIGYFKEAATAGPASSLRGRALLELTKAYVRKGDVGEALKIIDAAVDEFNEGEIREEFERMGSKLRQAGKNNAPQ